MWESLSLHLFESSIDENSDANGRIVRPGTRRNYDFLWQECGSFVKRTISGCPTRISSNYVSIFSFPLFFPSSRWTDSRTEQQKPTPQPPSPEAVAEVQTPAARLHQEQPPCRSRPEPTRACGQWQSLCDSQTARARHAGRARRCESPRWRPH